jgi:hypothetical protein
MNAKREEAGACRRLRGAGVALIAAGSLIVPVAVADASSSVSLKENGSLKRVGKAKGFDLNEKGYASGTIKGSISLSLHVVSTDKVTAKVSVYPKGGSLYGSGSASYHVHGGYAYFGGSLSITKGAGSWKGAHGSNLKFSGKIERANDAVSVNLSGTLYR